MTPLEPTRAEKAKALAARTSSATCPLCGRPIVREHRCTARPSLGTMPADFWDQVARAREDDAAPAPTIDPLPLFDVDPDA